MRADYRKFTDAGTDYAFDTEAPDLDDRPDSAELHDLAEEMKR